MQICEEHYKKFKKSVDKNKHALQALPGDFWSGDIGQPYVDAHSLTAFVQGMETSTHTTTMEHRQAFAWLFHHQIKM